MMTRSQSYCSNATSLRHVLVYLLTKDQASTMSVEPSLIMVIVTILQS